MADKKILAFRCTRTGLYFPGDYTEQWGRKYGIGLGPVPVSEALINNYDGRPVGREGAPNTLMHPVACCRAPIVACEVSEDEYKQRRAVLQSDDPALARRGTIMRDRQIAHNRIKREEDYII